VIDPQGYDAPREYWWREERGEVAGQVFATVQQLDDLQAYRRDANLHHMRLYSNRLATGLGGFSYAETDFGDRIKINAIKSVIDAATAQIASNRPRPQYLTEKGDYKRIRRAENLNKFVAGQFYAVDQYEVALQVFVDACVFGTGFEHVFHRAGEIQAERVFTNEIIVDDVESRTALPRSMFRHKEMDRTVLRAYAHQLREDRVVRRSKTEIDDKIDAAPLIRQDGQARAGKNSDMCSVVEAWHLASSRRAKDGRRVLALDGLELIDDREWSATRFPVARFRWCNAPLGFWGIGLAEDLTPLQIEINYLAQKIQTLMNLATTQFWVKRGEGGDALDIDNEDMGVREYKNTPPTVLNVQPIHQQVVDYIWTLFQRCYEIAGVSMSAAQSNVPVGLKSGEAIRRHSEIGSRRFQHVGQAWERFHMDVGHLIIDTAREIEESGIDAHQSVLAQGDDGVESLSFADVSIEQDKYITRVFPSSLLPDTPQGKVEQVSELARMFPDIGAQALGLLTGVPDVGSVASRINAPYKLVERQISNMLDGTPEHPLPGQNLMIAQEQAQLAVQQATVDGAPEDRLELLRRFADIAGIMLESAQQASMAEAAAMQPGAAPGPQSSPPGPAPRPAPAAGPLPLAS